MIWRRMQDFSTNAVAYILTSCPYSKAHYIRDYQQYKRIVSTDTP